MTDQRTIVGERPVFSEKAILTCLGDALSGIKAADKLSWDDVAAVLGVSDVQAAKYADGSAKMTAVTFYRAKREWNGRFTGAADRLCVESRPAAPDMDRTCGSRVLAAALAISKAVESGGEMDAREVFANRSELEQARDAIEHQLAKLTVRAA